MRGRTSLSFGVLAAACALAGCAALPWGAGGAEPMRATDGAFLRTFDAAALGRASERLGAAVGPAWTAGIALAGVEGDFDVDWEAWTILPGAPRLELVAPPPVQHSDAPPSGDFGLLAHVPLAAAEHPIVLSGDGLLAPCDVTVSVAEGELDVPMTLTVDKLGRVQGVVLDGATYHSLSPVSPNAILKADLTTCGGGLEPGAQLAALGAAFAKAAVAAVGDKLAAALPEALGLDLAFAWSGPVSADALGTGFMRAALRGLPNDPNALVRRHDDVVQIAWSFDVEADAHPCMGSVALPEPRAELPEVELPPGAALHIESFGRLVAASWLAGRACADHLGRIPIDAEPLADAWPELSRLGPGAELSLEVWPSALPRVDADAAMSDGLALEVGHVHADLIVTYAGARWRAASLELNLSVVGALWIDEHGAVELDPAAVEATPTSIDAGLLAAPSDAAIAHIVPPLVEALVIDRPLAQLPDSLTPAVAGPVTVDGDYLTWQPR